MLFRSPRVPHRRHPAVAPHPARGAPHHRAVVDVSTIGVVVCTHRRERLPLLRAAIASLHAQTRPPERIAVVVDGDIDLEAEVRAALPGVEVRGLGRNRGVSVARTVGAGDLDTDLVAFLDDDATAHPDWLEVLEGVLADPEVLGAGGRSDAVFDAPRPRWLPEEFLWTLGCSYRGQPQERAVVRNVYGGCALLRRDLFVELGGYDPTIGHHGDVAGGGEEAEFCLRATAATGGSFAYEPATGIDHRVPGERLTWSYFLRRCREEGAMKARLALAPRAVPGSLGPERSFALRLPVVALRYLLVPGPVSGRRAGGAVVLGAGAVLVGLATELITRRLRTRRTR